ncbi:MAG: hypothetical protein PHD01_11180 [Geobacteraceae bacterium]|nr:hypothetical protein [Geobacteraceae bacterium]
MKRLILEIFNDDRYFKAADYVILTINDEEIGEVKELSEKVRKSEGFEASMSHSCSAANADLAAEPDNGKVALKAYEGWMDAVHLTVAQEDFFVTGFYGYSDVSWRTAPVPISVLDEEGVYDLRKDSA